MCLSSTLQSPQAQLFFVNQFIILFLLFENPGQPVFLSSSLLSRPYSRLPSRVGRGYYSEEGSGRPAGSEHRGASFPAPCSPAQFEHCKSLHSLSTAKGTKERKRRPENRPALCPISSPWPPERVLAGIAFQGAVKPLQTGAGASLLLPNPLTKRTSPWRSSLSQLDTSSTNAVVSETLGSQRRLCKLEEVTPSRAVRG